MHAGETFEPAKPAELEMLAKGLLTAANDKSATSPRTRKQCLSPSQEQQLKGLWQNNETSGQVLVSCTADGIACCHDGLSFSKLLLLLVNFNALH